MIAELFAGLWAALAKDPGTAVMTTVTAIATGMSAVYARREWRRKLEADEPVVDVVASAERPTIQIMIENNAPYTLAVSCIEITRPSGTKLRTSSKTEYALKAIGRYVLQPAGRTNNKGSALDRMWLYYELEFPARFRGGEITITLDLQLNDRRTRHRRMTIHREISALAIAQAGPTQSTQG